MKLKPLILSIALMLLFTGGLPAQDKYEYASVIYSWAAAKVYVSINGNEFTEEKVELDKSVHNSNNTNPLINKINDLQTKGWEVVNLFSREYAHQAYLRKKKNQ